MHVVYDINHLNNHIVYCQVFNMKFLSDHVFFLTVLVRLNCWTREVGDWISGILFMYPKFWGRLVFGFPFCYNSKVSINDVIDPGWR